MEIKAWKCTKTGNLFETEQAFNEHKQALARAEQVEQERPELEARLDRLRRAPFEQATRVVDLFALLIGNYVEVVDLMVKLDKASEGTRAHRLSAIRPELLEFTALDRNITNALEVSPDTEGIAGDVYFEYQGPTGADCVEATAAFPLLNAGFTPWMFATSGDSTDGARGHRICLRRVNLLLAHLPHLAAARQEYESIGEQELTGLLDQQKARIAQLEATDPEYLQVHQRQEGVINQLSQLEVTKKTLDTQVRKAAMRIRHDALQSVPRLARFYELSELLYVS